MVKTFRMACWPLVLVALTTICSAQEAKEAKKAARPVGYYNHSGCLYSYIDGGMFEMLTADGEKLSENLTTSSLTYDSSKSRCTKMGETGKLVFSFKIKNNTKIKSVSVSMRIAESPSEGTWEFTQANLTIARADIDRKRTFPLRISDMYASLSHSFSCGELTMHTMPKRKADNETGRVDPRATITLSRFQVQPFAEGTDYVFAPSFDCSTWFSVPGLMGLILGLFIITMTVVGVNLLSRIETNDFKHNKEGQKFTQSQMESNKQG